MRNYRRLRRKLVGFTVLASGGSVFASDCVNFAASLPICGAVLTFCTPADQINVLWPILETPDYVADPSCTIPLGCGVRQDPDDFADGNFFPLAPPGIRGGTNPEQPTDESEGIGGGAGGGGTP